MAEQTNGAPSPEVEARTMGWTPQDQFRGDPEKWVDAETYLERGRTVMPILKKNNEKLLGELNDLKLNQKQLKASLDAANLTITEFKEFQATEVKRQVEARVADLRADKKAAIKAGDHELAADLDEEIDAAKEDLKSTPASTTKTVETKQAEPAVEPWAKAFYESNTEWLGVDKRKTGLFSGIAEDLYKEGLRGGELLEKAKEEMESTLNPKGRPAAKAESGNGGWGAGGSSGSGGGKAFKDLPSDAKEVCKAQERKFVGEGKAFKDSAAWQKHYADTYFASEN